jgi:hypothetical protein
MVRYNQTRRGHHPLICVPTTQQYRELANIHVKPTDVVLEVGSAHGKTTNLLATIARQVVGIDCDRKMLSHSVATYKRPNMSFHYFNALELNNTDWKPTLLPEGEQRFTVVFIDCGGTIPMYMLAPILKAIREGVKPRLIVCKSLNLDKLQHQIMQGKEENVPGTETGTGTRIITAIDQPVVVGLQRAVGRCQRRLWERAENWVARQQHIQCRVMLSVPDPVLVAVSSPRSDASKLKSWRVRAESSGIQVAQICRCFPVVASNNSNMHNFNDDSRPLVAIILAPGESFPTKPWSTCTSTVVRKLLSRDDYFAYSKYQMMSPFSHGFPVILSTKAVEYASSKDQKNRIVVECAPGRYLEFTGEEMLQLIAELVNNDVARGGTTSVVESSTSGDVQFIDDDSTSSSTCTTSTRFEWKWFSAGVVTTSVVAYLLSTRKR